MDNHVDSQGVAITSMLEYLVSVLQHSPEGRDARLAELLQSRQPAVAAWIADFLEHYDYTIANTVPTNEETFEGERYTLEMSGDVIERDDQGAPDE